MTNALLQSVKKHSLSLSVVIIYFLWACLELQAQMSFEVVHTRRPHELALMNGEGLMFGLFFFYIIGAILIIVIMCYMIARIKQVRYYAALLLLVLAIMFSLKLLVY